MTILVDVQGPKLGIGTVKEGLVQLGRGDLFVLDRSSAPGDKTRVCLPHRELFQALQPGSRLLLDDGKIALRVEKVEPERIETLVEVGGALSNHKGVNVPDVVVPMAALTEKARGDLAFALEHNVDWIAHSFVTRPEEGAEARQVNGGEEGLVGKIEKPSALHRPGDMPEIADPGNGRARGRER